MNSVVCPNMTINSSSTADSRNISKILNEPNLRSKIVTVPENKITVGPKRND